MLKILLPWLLALIVYGLFLAWYQNWRGPLSDDEVRQYRARLEASPMAEQGGVQEVADFLARDDGRAFLMVNLIKLAREPVPDPESGVPRPAADLLDEYTRVFLGAALRRASHPALVAGKVGGYVESWNVEADPGGVATDWTALGLVRYRSRRDLAELVLMDGLDAAHDYKIAAMPATFAFPAQVRMGLMLGPQIWVGLLLALFAALGSLAVALLR
ncbi:MAG: hypothetical protein JJT88_07535 [Gammaproteobacteria bacterium]|nr:hypothetical protein [Gammaproteobacteria bacterium]